MPDVTSETSLIVDHIIKRNENDPGTFNVYFANIDPDNDGVLSETFYEGVMRHIPQADWNESNSASLAFIDHKPTITQSNWTENDSTKLSYIQNKPASVIEDVNIILNPNIVQGQNTIIKIADIDINKDGTTSTTALYIPEVQIQPSYTATSSIEVDTEEEINGEIVNSTTVVTVDNIDLGSINNTHIYAPPSSGQGGNAASLTWDNVKNKPSIVSYIISDYNMDHLEDYLPIANYYQIDYDNNEPRTASYGIYIPKSIETGIYVNLSNYNYYAENVNTTATRSITSQESENILALGSTQKYIDHIMHYSKTSVYNQNENNLFVDLKNLALAIEERKRGFILLFNKIIPITSAKIIYNTNQTSVVDYIIFDLPVISTENNLTSISTRFDTNNISQTADALTVTQQHKTLILDYNAADGILYCI